MNKYDIEIVGDPNLGEVIEADSMEIIRNCIYFYKTNKEGQSYIAYIYPSTHTIVKRLIY